MSDVSTMGNRIRYLIDHGIVEINQTELAKRVGVSRNTIGRIIRDEHDPGVSIVSKISEILQVDLIWLITGQAYEEIPKVKELIDEGWDTLKKVVEDRPKEDILEKGIRQSFDFSGDNNTFAQSYYGKVLVKESAEESAYKVPKKDYLIFKKYLNLKDKDRQAVATLIESLSKD